MVLGARQVGKTFLIEEFCKNEFKNYKVFNLLENTEIIDLFKQNINSEDKYTQLALMLDFDIEDENSIIFVDEVQKSPEFISALKFFCEKHNNVNIICAGSLLGVMLTRTSMSFPVGKVYLENMYPMDFEEFLIATGHEKWIENINICYRENKQMPEPMHSNLLKLYRYYLWIGGMPESVQNFIDNEQNILKYNENIISDIIESYFNDMKNYIKSDSEALKTKKLYSQIGSQLQNPSKKFQYSKIDKNSKSRDYELSLEWLINSRLVLRTDLVKLPKIPPRGFVDYDVFKLFLSDVAILIRQLGILPKDVIGDNLSLYKGIVTENYVACEFKQNGIDLLYWTSDNTAEVDFLLYNEDGVIPVEVKSSGNTQSKSLKVYMEKFNPKYAIRISSKNFAFENNIKSVPLYAVFCIK